MILYYTRMTSMTTQLNIKILNIPLHIVTSDFFLFPVVVCLKLPFLESFVVLLNIVHSPNIRINIQLHFLLLLLILSSIVLSIIIIITAFFTRGIIFLQGCRRSSSKVVFMVWPRTILNSVSGLVDLWVSGLVLVLLDYL